jgi:hypothetical protein
MPLPMVHCAIAIQLGARHQSLPSAPFLLGSIAPDAIHMRPNAQRADKHRTHLDEPADTPDHAHLQALLSRYAGAAESLAQFTAGYVAHILADRLWLRTVIPAFQAQLPTDIDPDAARTLYYQETDQIDFNLYHHSPWRPMVWAQLAAAIAPQYDPLLSASEIDGWRQRTLRWFDTLKQEPRITPTYITDAVVEDFIGQALDEVGDKFSQWQSIEEVFRDPSLPHPAR